MLSYSKIIGSVILLLKLTLGDECLFATVGDCFLKLIFVTFWPKIETFEYLKTWRKKWEKLPPNGQNLDNGKIYFKE